MKVNYDDFEFGMVPQPIIISLFDDVEHRSLSPLSCLREFDGYWILECDLPLVNEKDIKISFQADTISIEAKLKEKYSEERLGKFTKFEFFKRSVSLPGNIEIKKTTAIFKKGRLEVRIPKKLSGNSIQIN